MTTNIHDDFERTAFEREQAPNIRAANEHLHRRIAELEAEVQRLRNNPEMPPTHFFIARDGSAWERVFLTSSQ